MKWPKIKTLLFLLAVLAAAAIALLAAGWLAFSFFHFRLPSTDLPGTVAAGFTPLYLTQGTSYISSDPYFNEPSYAVVVLADGSSGSLRGHFTPAQMSEFTGQKRPSGDFDLTIDVLNESCKNTLLNGSIRVYSYSMSTSQANWNTAAPGSWWCWGGAYLTIMHRGDGATSCTNSISQQCYCTNINQNFEGEAFLLDTVNHYDSKINISLITSNDSYSLLLSPTQRNGEIVNSVKAQFLNNVMGDQSCPTAAVDTVIFRPANTNQFLPKNRAYYNSLLTYASLPPASIDAANQVNSVVSTFKSSSAPTSEYCSGVVASGQTAQYSCQPVSPVAIPQLKLNIKASILGVVVPSGIPKIVSINNPIATAGTTTSYDVTLQNLGEADSFDLSITGPRQVNLQAAREAFQAGEQKTVKVYLQGAGIIGDYILTATSVNDAKKSDSMTFKLKIDPYCDRAAEPGKSKVSTEYGCFYVCENQYSTDVREKTCQPFGTFETRGAYVSLYQEGLDPQGRPVYKNLGLDGELHCVGIGQYVPLIDYMDYVYSPRIEFDLIKGSVNSSRTFTPGKINGAVWLPAPVCNYVGEYGYAYANGQVSIVESDEFTSGRSPPAGQLTSTGNIVSCAEGYVYDPQIRTCKYSPPSAIICPAGDVYNPSTKQCEQYANVTVILSPNYICPSGTTLNQSGETPKCDITPQTSVVCTNGVYNPVTEHCETEGQQETICPLNYTLTNGICVLQAPIGQGTRNIDLSGILALVAGVIAVLVGVALLLFLGWRILKKVSK